jgi:hypothetical protein
MAQNEDLLEIVHQVWAAHSAISMASLQEFMFFDPEVVFDLRISRCWTFGSDASLDRFRLETLIHE